MKTALKEIVWVCGGVASGKDRFIRRVIAGEEQDVCRRLGWSSSLLAVSESSLNYIGRFPGDTEMTSLRHKITDDISTLDSNVEVVLIKEQRVDLKARRPEMLQELYPNAQHTLIILDCTDAIERMERYKMKPFAHNDETYEGLVEKFNVSLDLLSRLSDFKIRCFDSSRNKSYVDIPVPLELATNR